MKTTVLGIAGILGILAKIYSTKTIDQTDATAIATSIGLILAADSKK